MAVRLSLHAKTFFEKANCSGPAKSEYGAVEIGALQCMGIDFPVGTGISVAEGAAVCPAAVKVSCFVEIEFLHFFSPFIRRWLCDCLIIFSNEPCMD